jgi:hypothetical protein
VYEEALEKLRGLKPEAATYLEAASPENWVEVLFRHTRTHPTNTSRAGVSVSLLPSLPSTPSMHAPDLLTSFFNPTCASPP